MKKDCYVTFLCIDIILIIIMNVSINSLVKKTVVLKLGLEAVITFLSLMLLQRGGVTSIDMEFQGEVSSFHQAVLIRSGIT
jgi:hypothetical protein